MLMPEVVVAVDHGTPLSGADKLCESTLRKVLKRLSTATPKTLTTGKSWTHRTVYYNCKTIRVVVYLIKIIENVLSLNFAPPNCMPIEEMKTKLLVPMELFCHPM